MNRIYQGKVTNVQTLKPGTRGNASDDWQDLPDWPHVLWQHHQLFQDAVNYYIVCLLALANDPQSDAWKIREWMTTEGSELFVWGSFRRRGATRHGMRESVGPYLVPGTSEPTFEACAKAALAGNEAINPVRDFALQELLFKCSGNNPIKNQGAWMLARFCIPTYKGGFSFDAAAAVRKTGEMRLGTELYALSTQTELETFAGNLEISWVVNLAKDAKPFIGEMARGRLLKAVDHFQQVFGGSADTKMGNRVKTYLRAQVGALAALTTIREKIIAIPVEQLPVIPANNRSIPDRLEACFLFKYYPCPFTAELLKVSFPQQKPAASSTTESADNPTIRFLSQDGDPIERARGRRGYVFRAFTSLPCWNPADAPEPQWKEFDIVAFKEALKALHQIDDKGKERRKELARKKAQWEYQRQFDFEKQQSVSRKWKGVGTNEEEQRPSVLVGDPRIARLEQLVDVELCAEYEMSEGVEVKYGLHPRTIRGFRELRKKWNDALGASKPYSDADRKKLWNILTDYKKENAETIGSPVLFDALVNEPNWIIWREPNVEQLHNWRKAAKLPDDAEFAKDPLQALTDERELLGDIERLKQPIRLTPADPVHSRRQFYFPDVTNLSANRRLRHDQRFLDSEIIFKKDGKIERRSVRLYFAAPRLLRDRLTTNNDAKRQPLWQQPMMEALGLKMGLTKKGKPAEFADCTAVALMPEITASGDQRILLNFSVTLEAEAIAKQLGKAVRWDVLQFGGADGKSYWLRWPTTWLKEKADRKKPLPKPWWESGEPFRCLSVDLGQRDAGAFALLEVTVGNAPKKQSRMLGEAGGKSWWATVRSTGMLRLPGEDAMVLREGKWQEEFFGVRGRLTTLAEWEEAGDICTRLGLDPVKIIGDDPKRYSFPELNDKLLYVLRRAQARLARLQSWSCIADKETDEKRRKRITEEIAESVTQIRQNEPEAELSNWEKLLLEIKPLVEKKVWNVVASRLIEEAEKERAVIPCELICIADRIQPLRSRRWEWVIRDQGQRSYWLQQTRPGTDPRPKLLAGQRGLSMKRLEQLDSLRQRCQSLNRALQHTPGKKPVQGRHTRGEELPDPCPELLERLDNLKEQRVNQTAHLILAQALGVRLRPHTSDAATSESRDIHGEYEPIPGRQPVDFVVIENLKYYEMTQGRSRRENVRLMKWCRRHLRDKLIELCEPYGLRVLEEWPADTSKFCSLTGVAGFRAVELTPDNRKDFRWRKHLERLADPERAKKLSKDERKESQHVKAIFDALDLLNVGLLKNRSVRPKWRTLIAPVAGGPIFVPMHGNPLQADINAAINLGLRAIAAPENHRIHLRLRGERKGDKFFVRVENIREKARWKDSVSEIRVTTEKDRAVLLAEARPNFFADLGNVARYDHATVGKLAVAVASGRGLWGTINQNDWLRVNVLNNDRLEKAGLKRPLKEEDNIPM